MRKCENEEIRKCENACRTNGGNECTNVLMYRCANAYPPTAVVDEEMWKCGNVKMLARLTAGENEEISKC
ncbi:MAG: hypothetical protein RL732_1022, partial [Bacteroidota bacterium]